VSGRITRGVVDSSGVYYFYVCIKCHAGPVVPAHVTYLTTPVLLETHVPYRAREYQEHRLLTLLVEPTGAPGVFKNVI